MTAATALAPACQTAIRQAMTYIGAKTQPWTPAQRQRVRQDAQCQTLEAAVYAAAATGDLGATQAACRAWWAYILG